MKNSLKKLFREKNANCDDYLPRTDRTIFFLILIISCRNFVYVISNIRSSLARASTKKKSTSQVSQLAFRKFIVQWMNLRRKRNNKSLLRVFSHETGCIGECRLACYDRNTSFYFGTQHSTTATRWFLDWRTRNDMQNFAIEWKFHWNSVPAVGVSREFLCTNRWRDYPITTRMPLNAFHKS